MAGKWSKDGQWLTFGTNESPNLRNQDGYLLRHDGGEFKKVFSVREGSRESLADWHPDGKRLAVSSDSGGTSRPGILDLDTGEVRWLGKEGIDEFASEFSGGWRMALVIRNEDSSLKPILYKVESGEARELALPPGLAMGGGFVLGDKKLLVQHSAANRRPELLLYDLASDIYETLLSAEDGPIDPKLFVADEHVKYPSFDGQAVPAILYKPQGAGESNEKLPAIIHVHGGPTGQFFRGFDLYAQFLVASGFVVLEPNVRGSTGYGVTWRDCNIKDWGGGDLEDVAAGAEYLKTLPYVDPARIGVFGGSYGGFMSFIAVVKKPDLLRSAYPGSASPTCTSSTKRTWSTSATTSGSRWATPRPITPSGAIAARSSSPTS